MGRVKTNSELRDALRKKKKSDSEADFDTKYLCAGCGKEYSATHSQGLRFCEDGMRIVAVKVTRKSVNQQAAKSNEDAVAGIWH